MLPYLALHLMTNLCSADGAVALVSSTWQSKLGSCCISDAADTDNRYALAAFELVDESNMLLSASVFEDQSVSQNILQTHAAVRSGIMLRLEDEMAGLIEAAEVPADSHGAHSTKPDPASSVTGEASQSNSADAWVVCCAAALLGLLLCCAVLYCTVLWCAVPCCAVLCCACSDAL